MECAANSSGARAKRARPQLDDKLIAGWNGLMICTLAKAGGLLNRDDYLAAARRAWTFITDEMTADKRLKRCYCRGEAYIEAFHEDYAYLIHGTLALFHATAEPHYLARAIHLQGVLDETFVNSDTSFSGQLSAIPPGDAQGAEPPGRCPACSQFHNNSEPHSPGQAL